MSIKQLESKKLYFSKYLYKLSIVNNYAWVFRSAKQHDGYRVLLEHGDFLESMSGKKALGLFQPMEYKQLVDIVNIIENATSEYKLRTESNVISVFSNDKDWLLSLTLTFTTSTNKFTFYEPTAETVNLVLDGSVVVSDPKLKDFNYRIYFQKHVPASFLDWVDKNSEKVFIGKELYSRIKYNRNVYGYYMYVNNNKTLTLITLMIGNSIRRTINVAHKEK